MQKAEVLSKQEGPCVKAIDRELQVIGVQRQAYYSGTFVGNHVHKLLKVNSYAL